MGGPGGARGEQRRLRQHKLRERECLRVIICAAGERGPGAEAYLHRRRPGHATARTSVRARVAGSRLDWHEASRRGAGCKYTGPPVLDSIEPGAVRSYERLTRRKTRRPRLFFKPRAPLAHAETRRVPGARHHRGRCTTRERHIQSKRSTRLVLLHTTPHPSSRQPHAATTIMILQHCRHPLCPRLAVAPVTIGAITRAHMSPARCMQGSAPLAIALRPRRAAPQSAGTPPPITTDAWSLSTPQRHRRRRRRLIWRP